MLTGRANTICIYKILLEHSDECHPLSVNEIISYLKREYGLSIDRRTVYNSIDTLKELDYDISTYDENKHGYYLRTRVLSTADVRLICDALYSLYSVSNKLTEELVERLQSVLSEHSRQYFKHLTSISVSRKTDNSSVFKNIGSIDQAISRRVKISFVYMQYGLDKKLHPRRNDLYIVNPYGMVCENGNYYLLCVKDGKSGLSHYRIDLMKDVRILAAKIETKVSAFDIASAKKAVYAFAGKPEEITLRCHKRMISGLIDRFGTEPRIYKLDDSYFIAKIKAVPQGMLFWTMQYLSDVEILEPASLRQQAIEMIKSNLYNV